MLNLLDLTHHYLINPKTSCNHLWKNEEKLNRQTNVKSRIPSTEIARKQEGKPQNIVLDTIQLHLHEKTTMEEKRKHIKELYRVRHNSHTQSDQYKGLKEYSDVLIPRKCFTNMMDHPVR